MSLRPLSAPVVLAAILATASFCMAKDSPEVRQLKLENKMLRDRVAQLKEAQKLADEVSRLKRELAARDAEIAALRVEIELLKKDHADEDPNANGSQADPDDATDGGRDDDQENKDGIPDYFVKLIGKENLDKAKELSASHDEKAMKWVRDFNAKAARALKGKAVTVIVRASSCSVWARGDKASLYAYFNHRDGRVRLGGRAKGYDIPQLQATRIKQALEDGTKWIKIKVGKIEATTDRTGIEFEMEPATGSSRFYFGSSAMLVDAPKDADGDKQDDPDDPDE